MVYYGKGGTSSDKSSPTASVSNLHFKDHTTTCLVCYHKNSMLASFCYISTMVFSAGVKCLPFHAQFLDRLGRRVCANTTLNFNTLLSVNTLCVHDLETPDISSHRLFKSKTYLFCD